MSEEEKKVIEHLKIERDYAYKFNNKHMITITTMALNIINKQQKEIEDLNEKIIELKEKEIIKKSLIPTQEKFEDYYNYISKDKIKEIIEELNNLKLQDERLDKASIDFAINKIQELL